MACMPGGVQLQACTPMGNQSTESACPGGISTASHTHLPAWLERIRYGGLIAGLQLHACFKQAEPIVLACTSCAHDIA
jgi:hypothetical protein